MKLFLRSDTQEGVNMGLSNKQFLKSILLLREKSNSKLHVANKPVNTVAVTVKLKQKTLLKKSKYRIERKPPLPLSKAFLKNPWYELKEIRRRHLIVSVISCCLLTLCGIIMIEICGLQTTGQQIIYIEAVLYLISLLCLVYVIQNVTKMKRCSNIEVIV